MLSASSRANGAIATGTILVATRYFQESSNRILAAQVGIEPTTNALTVRCTTAVLLSNNSGDTYGIRTRDLYRDRVAH